MAPTAQQRGLHLGVSRAPVALSLLNNCHVTKGSDVRARRVVERAQFVISNTIVFRSQNSTKMRPIATDRVAWSVCLSVCDDRDPCKTLNRSKGKERKRKSIYIALFWPRWYTQSAQVWITQFYLQITPCLPFLRGVHQMSPPQQLRQRTSNCSSLLIYRPRKDERLSWPSWLTYSGWFTHISGHTSAAGRAQDSESTPAKDRCYTAGPRNQLDDFWVVDSGGSKKAWGGHIGATGRI